MRGRSGFGWLELVIGIVLIVLGVFAFAAPDLALTGLVFAYGIAGVLVGVADMVRGSELSVMTGLVLVVYPSTGVLVLTLLFPIWFIAHGISRLVHLGHIRFVAGRGIYYFTLVINIIGLVLGFLMLFDPLFTLTTIRCFASAYLILLGIDSVVIAVSRMGRRL